MEMEVCNEQTANKLGSTITNFLSKLNNDNNTSQSKPTPTVETNGELEVDKKDGREEMPIITPKTQQAINRGITPKSQQVINDTFTTPTAATPSASTSSIVSPLSNKGAESPTRGDINTTSPSSPSTPSQSPSRLDAEYFSSKNYSRKKSAEMKVMFAKKQRAVSDIINAMNERGIGGVNLKNVQVEAFIHPSLRKSKEELEGDGEFMEMLGKALDERNEGGEGMDQVGIDGSGEGMGEEEQTISSEQAMAGGRGSGGMTTPSTAQRQRGIRESEQNPYVVQPESSETYLEQAFKSSRGITRDPNSPNNKNVTPDPASLVADQIADTYETEHNRVITGDGQGMEYRDTLNSEAYKMNASKNATFRKMGSKGGNGPPVNQDFVKDINDVVNDMADKQSKVRPLTNEEYAAPMKDAESEEYERQLKQQLNENKKDRLNIQPPPSRGYGGGAKASRSPRATPTKNVDVELSNESNRLASETSSKQNARVVSSENDDEYMARKRAQEEFAEAAAKQADKEEEANEEDMDEVDRVPDEEEEGMKVNPMDTTDAAIILGGEEDEEEGGEAAEAEGDDQVKEDPPAENEEDVEVELEDVKLDESKGDIEEANKEKKAKDKTPQPIESVMDVPPQGTCCTCSCVVS